MSRHYSARFNSAGPSQEAGILAGHGRKFGGWTVRGHHGLRRCSTAGGVAADCDCDCDKSDQESKSQTKYVPIHSASETRS